MPEVDAILARFPGPVTLHTSRLKLFFIFVMFLGLALFCVLVLIPGRAHGWYEMTLSVIAAIFCSAVAAMGAVMLLFGAASLTLDADGFEICKLRKRVRFRWQDASGFRVMTEDEMDREIAEHLWTKAHIGPFAFDLRVTGPGPQHRVGKMREALPDNYRLSKNDFMRLLQEWRQRALAVAGANPSA